MSTKHFDAIRAKNDIAREIASGDPNFDFIISQLRQIESYIGEANLPCVSDIISNNSDPNRQFDI